MTDRDAGRREQFSGVQIIRHHLGHDARGFLRRLYDANFLDTSRPAPDVSQVNCVVIEESGTVKGLHLQKPPAQEAKMVACISGRVWDVALDLRPESETYGQHFAIELNGNDPVSLLIPEGFAHGVQCLEPGSIMHYIHSAPYSPEHEAGVNALDPDLGIDWPLPPANLSERDRLLPRLKDLEC